MVMTGVPDPLVWLQIWEEVDGSPIHSLAGESEKVSVMVVRLAISR